MSDPTEAQLIQQKLDAESRAENAHKTWRYRYRAGPNPERKLFNHPDDVPESEGWVDSPALCQEPPATVAANPETNGVTVTNPEYDFPESVNMKTLRTRYAAVTNGGKVPVGTSKAAAQQMIRDAIAETNPHAA